LARRRAGIALTTKETAKGGTMARVGLQSGAGNALVTRLRSSVPTLILLLVLVLLVAGCGKHGKY
jgi:hypothetical protein